MTLRSKREDPVAEPSTGTVAPLTKLGGQAMGSDKLTDALHELTAEMRALRKEMQRAHAADEKRATTRRVKAARHVVRLKDVPVDDVAAAAAARALAKVRR